MSNNDVSPNHFDWLVGCRSSNQKSTVILYRILKENEAVLNRSVKLQGAAQTLTGVAFSLWRSVFLSDVSEDADHQYADLNKFLVSLIADNIVLYQTDKNSRNWSFRYYLDNAEFRLGSMSSLSSDIIPLIEKAAGSEKERWHNAQMALECAIAGFKEAVSAASQIST